MSHDFRRTPEQLIRLARIAWFSPVDELDLSIIELEGQPVDVSGLAVADSLPVLPHTSGQLERLVDEPPQVTVIGHPAGLQLTFSLGGFLLDHDDTALQHMPTLQ